MTYTPNSPAWTSSTNITAARLNHLQLQYKSITDYLASHNHDARYYKKSYMDSYYWNASNDGSGSTLNADKLEGLEASAISSGIDNGVIAFWYGYIGEFTGKLLTGYPSWHIADGSDGTVDLTEVFPIGASAIGSGYQPGDSIGNSTFKPVGSVIIYPHVLTFSEIMHTHDMYEKSWEGISHTSYTYDDYDYCKHQISTTLVSESKTTTATGSGLPHTHGGTFEGNTSSLIPPFMALIPIQYIGT